MADKEQTQITCTQRAPVKLNLGGGTVELPGYINVDRCNGQEAYPLDGQPEADEIRAVHLLEHFSHRVILKVLADWANHLKPGGVLKISVPDIDVIAWRHIHGTNEPTERYILGAHANQSDVHGALFSEAKLRSGMHFVGLEDIRRWKPEHNDCAALPISLNLQGTKPLHEPEQLTVAACMSMPRLTFSDNFFCAYGAFLKDDIRLFKNTGALWGQSLERCMVSAMKSLPDLDALIVLDYDSVFSRQNVHDLLRLAGLHPEADAIATLQVARSESRPMVSLYDENDKIIHEVPRETWDGDLTKVTTAHFGLTLIRTAALKTLPHPWFLGEPNDDGEWGENRTDDDMYFWRKWRRYGHTLFQANRIPIGHAELMIRWPSRNLSAMHQHPNDYWDHDQQPPGGVWI